MSQIATEEPGINSPVPDEFVPLNWAHLYYYVPETHAYLRDRFREVVRRNGLFSDDGSVWIGPVNAVTEMKIKQAIIALKADCPQAIVHYYPGLYDVEYAREQTDEVRKAINQEIQQIEESILSLEKAVAGDEPILDKDDKPLTSAKLIRRGQSRYDGALALLDSLDASSTRLNDSGLQNVGKDLRLRVSQVRAWVANSKAGFSVWAEKEKAISRGQTQL